MKQQIALVKDVLLLLFSVDSNKQNALEYGNQIWTQRKTNKQVEVKLQLNQLQLKLPKHASSILIHHIYLANHEEDIHILI